MTDVSFVLVVGMHRSGTSVVSGMLSKIGVDFGSNLLGATYANPAGHYEDKELIRINEDLLIASGGSWDAPPSDDNIRKAFSDRKDRIKKYLKNESRSKSGEYYGIKEPRVSLMIPMYADVLCDVKIIYVTRDEREVANSINKRNKIGLSYAVNLCRYYNREIEKGLIESGESCFEIDYGDLMRDSSRVVEEVLSFLEIDVSERCKLEASSFVKSKSILDVKSKELKRKSKRRMLEKVVKNPLKAFSVFLYIVYRAYKRAIWKG